jgi:pilus assembly protein CpaB
MKPGTLIVLLAALMVGGFAAFLAHAIVTKPSLARADTPVSTIVLAARPLDYGNTLDEDNLIEAPWASSIVPEGAFRSKADVLKDGQRAVLTAMEKNEPVLVSRITGPNQPPSLAAVVEPGMRAVAIRVDEVRGVAGFVRKGDRVDVILTRAESRSETNSSYADVLLENVKILAVGQISNERQDHATVVKTVTLEVTTQQAQKLVLADGVGTLALVLRQAGAANAEAVRRISLADLGQGEYAGAGKDATSSLSQKAAAPESALSDGPALTAATERARVVIYRGTPKGITSTPYDQVYREAR